MMEVLTFSFLIQHPTSKYITFFYTVYNATLYMLVYCTIVLPVIYPPPLAVDRTHVRVVNGMWYMGMTSPNGYLTSDFQLTVLTLASVQKMTGGKRFEFAQNIENHLFCFVFALQHVLC